MLIVLPSHWEEKTTDYFFQTTQILAKNNQVVIYHLENLDKNTSLLKRIVQRRQLLPIWTDQNKITHLCPINFFPFLRFKLIRKLNLKLDILFLFLISNKSEKLLWIFDPTSLNLQSVFKYFSKVIFDCVDYHGSSLTKESRLIKKNAIEVAKKADYVMTNSHTLLNFYQKDNKIPHTYLVPQGFRAGSFEDVASAKQPQKKNQRKKIGFIGGISRRIDLKLLLQLATNRTDLDFVFVGPVISFEGQSRRFLHQLKELKELPNVFFTGNIAEKAKIPTMIDQFDVCTIPYDISLDFNRFCYPMKLFEYFYLGKPVISTPIEELTRKEFEQIVKIGTTAEEWSSHVNTLLAKPWPKSYQEKQKQLALKNSWENKISAISEIISSSPT